MPHRFFRVFTCVILAMLGNASANSADKFPLRVLPDGTNYCVHDIQVESNLSTNQEEATANSVIALSEAIESAGGELIYYDWRDEKSFEVLFENSCDQVDIGIKDYRSSFIGNVKTLVSGFQAYDASSRIMFESDPRYPKNLVAGFKFQTKYALDDCVVRIELKDKARERSEAAEEIFVIARIFSLGKAEFGFPILFANTLSNNSAYLLFWEHCDAKTELASKFLYNIGRNDPEQDFLDDVLIQEEKDINEINKAFYVE